MKTVKTILKVTAWAGLVINIFSSVGFVLALHYMNSLGSNFAKQAGVELQTPWEATFSQVGHVFQKFMQSPLNFNDKDIAFVFMSIIVYITTIVLLISLTNKKEAE